MTPTLVQAAGAIAVLVGVALALPLWGSLIVDGVAVLLLGVAAERIALGRRSGSSDRRRGENSKGAV